MKKLILVGMIILGTLANANELTGSSSNEARMIEARTVKTANKITINKIANLQLLCELIEYYDPIVKLEVEKNKAISRIKLLESFVMDNKISDEEYNVMKNYYSLAKKLNDSYTEDIDYISNLLDNRSK